MRLKNLILFIFTSISCIAQTKVSELTDISVDVPYGFHFITHYECKTWGLHPNSKAWIKEIAGESEVCDIREMLGLINNDIFEYYNNTDAFKNLNTPLKRKMFIDSEQYKELNEYFQNDRDLLLNHPIVFSTRNFSDYDLDKKGFFIKLPFLWMVNKAYLGDSDNIFPWHLCPNQEIGFSIPKKFLKKFFKEDYYNSSSLRPGKYYLNELLVHIKNEKIAIKIENETNSNKNFEFILVTHVSTKNRPEFIVDDMILYHIPTELVIWSASKGDLSGTLSL